MNRLVGGIFTNADSLTMATLDHRLKRSETIGANIANAETPGFRAIGYDFEEQLQQLSGRDARMHVEVSHPRHMRSGLTFADGTVRPDIYVRPTEAIGEDGNTVDVDAEMARLAQNQIQYRTAVEMINRKVGILRYAISGGR